jgi:hypothetical protein
MQSPLPRPRRRRWLPLARHVMRARALALARLRAARMKAGYPYRVPWRPPWRPPGA